MRSDREGKTANDASLREVSSRKAGMLVKNIRTNYFRVFKSIM
jgi:hypothetical protein